MLEFLGLVLATAGLLGCLNRLRQISWRTTRWLVVAFYLIGAFWSLGILNDVAHLEWYQLLGMVAILLALWGSRHRWRHGPPAGTTKPAPLGDPETQ